MTGKVAGRRRRWVIVVLAVMIAFLAGIVWFGMTRSTNPSQQQRITMPGMSGEETYLVNLWTDPEQPQAGSVRLTAQVTSIIGRPIELSAVTFRLTAPDGSSSEQAASPATDSDSPEAAMSAPVDLDQPGTWRVTVDITTGSIQRQATFSIEVDES